MQIGLFLALITACLAYHTYEVKRQEELQVATLNFCFKVLGAMFCAYLTHYALFTTLIYRKAMRLFQNYEYAKHKTMLAVQGIVVVPALFYLTIVLYVDSVSSSCKQSVSEFHLTEAPDSFCRTFRGLTAKDSSFYGLLISELVLFTPCIIFYVFRSTTNSCDCFTCFNRIPHLRYSIY